MSSMQTQVAHIWRRLGFGPAPGDIDAGVAVGPQALIDDLLSRPARKATPASPNPWGFPTGTDYLAADAYAVRLMELMAGAGSPENPLQERVAWILHGLLVASMAPGTIGIADLHDHLTLLRSSVFGSYKRLLADVSVRPAMLTFLNGYQNTRAHPNQNFARELMELFSLGARSPRTGEANYTQADVQEIARALTGWQRDWATSAPFFNVAAWDPGVKTFRGQSLGYARIKEVIDALAAHPSFAYHVPRYFYRELVGLEPSPEILDTLAEAWGPEGDILALVAEIVGLPEFLSDQAIFSKAKQPVELVAGAARLLGHTWLGSTALSLPYALSRLQQHPLRAPNVSGWPKGDQWLGASNLIGWSGLAGTMAMTGFNWAGAIVGPVCPTVLRLFTEETPITAAARALAMAGLGAASAETRAGVDAYARGGPWTAARAAGALYLVLVSPEYLVK